MIYQSCKSNLSPLTPLRIDLYIVDKIKYSTQSQPTLILFLEWYIALCMPVIVELLFQS